MPVEQTKANIYSRDRNIWHLSHEGGVLESPANAPDEAMWQWIISPERAPDKSTEVEIGFEGGTPVSVNGKKLAPLALLEEFNTSLAANGVGRIDLVENRLVGIKSRGAYETPAGTLLMMAHRELEALTVDRETTHYAQMLSLRYAELVYYGLWFTALREALDSIFCHCARARHRFRRTASLQRQRQRDAPPIALFALSFRTREFLDEELPPQGRRGLHQFDGAPDYAAAGVAAADSVSTSSCCDRPRLKSVSADSHPRIGTSSGADGSISRPTRYSTSFSARSRLTGVCCHTN